MLKHDNSATTEDFGTCCICTTEGCEANPVRTLIQLNWTAPVPGTGWGCVQCGVPCDGAIAVLCDSCAAGLRDGNHTIEGDLYHVVSGEVTGKGRMPAKVWRRNREAFSHDYRKHPETVGAHPN